MEKIYLVPEVSRLYKDFVRFKENKEPEKKVINEIFGKFGIETNYYWSHKETVSIDATENDIENFRDQLEYNENEGLYSFKKDSQISVEWRRASENLILSEMQQISSYFKFDGVKYYSCLKMLDGKLYLRFSADLHFEPIDNLIEVVGEEYDYLKEKFEEQ